MSVADRRFDREILRLAGPAFVTLLAEPVYLLADTAVVGHLGTAQLGGLAVASSILLTANSLCIFLAYGTTAAVARLVGAGERRAATHQAVQGVWLGALVGVVLALVLAATSEPLIAALGAEGEVAANALVYLRVSLLGLPFLLVVLAGTGYLRGVQDTRTPLVVAVFTATLNLVLELFLVYGLDKGIGASALGTVIAQVTGAAIYLVVVARGGRAAGVSLAPHLATQRRLLVVGRDLVVRTAALRGSLLALTAVAARIGPASVAAHQVAFEIWSFLAMALDALAIAAQAMVGRLLGAGRAADARAAGRRLLVLALVGGAITTVLVLALTPLLPHVFTSDDVVADRIRLLLVWVAVLQPLAAVAFVLDGVLIGAGDQRFLAWAMAGAAAAMGVALVPVLPLGLGIGAVWAAFGVLMAVRVVTLVVRFRGDRWTVLGARA